MFEFVTYERGSIIIYIYFIFIFYLIITFNFKSVLNLSSINKNKNKNILPLSSLHSYNLKTNILYNSLILIFWPIIIAIFIYFKIKQFEENLQNLKYT